MIQIKIKSIEKATHNVMHIKTEKPDQVDYLAGQAVDVAVDKPNWETKSRAFTFTSLPTDNYLEFFIKTYPEHKGVTDQISQLKQGDLLLIGETFGDIQYAGEGIFIAGGAGVTPFIAILKELEVENNIGNNKLIFANNTADDIIQERFFNQMLGKNFINVLSKENKEGYEHGYITKELIESHMQGKNTHFYLCGPPPMMDAVLEQLRELGVDDAKIIKEQF
ncbi:MAG TPA: FAD-binding oxidoreductase [Flavobacterium sp.]|nr:FAD-binding oxidoreductase [Flavobacterium sp.]